MCDKSLSAWLYLNKTKGSETRRSFKSALMLLSRNHVHLSAIDLSPHRRLLPNPQLKRSPCTSENPPSTSRFTHFRYCATVQALAISSCSNSMWFCVSHGFLEGNRRGVISSTTSSGCLLSRW